MNRSGNPSHSILFLIQAAMIAALYVVLTALAAGFDLASGAIQVRFSEVLTILPFFTPAAVPGVTLGCLLANILTGAALPDIVFGTLATFLGALGTRLLRKHRFLCTLPPVLSNGIIIPPKGYLPGVRKICDKYGIMMVCDEVMAGWCRTGRMFAFQHFDVKPDIVTFAKGVTCGYVQLGGVCVSKEIAAYFDDHVLSCGLTYNGHPLACAAGVACVNYYLKHDIPGHVTEVGKVLGELLEEMKAKHPCVGDVRYIGLFSAVELVKDKTTREPLVPYGRDPEGIMGKVLGMLKAKRFMTFGHENMILVAPPLIITEAQLREELAKLDEVLGEVDKMI